MSTSQNVTWSSSTSFILATIGIAVGLGNVWRFPYMVGTNGGSAFVLVYLISLLCFAVPIMIAEMIIGRQGGKDPLGTLRVLTKKGNNSKGWHVIGWLSLAIPFMGFSYYSVVAGWTIDYSVQSLLGTFQNIDGEASSAYFHSLSGSPTKSTLFFLLFAGMCTFIVSKSLRVGLERCVKILTPLIFAILIFLVIYSAIEGDFKRGFNYLFKLHPEKINSDVILAAMGQAFFSLGAATGGAMAYASYLDKSVSIPRSVLIVAMADTTVALLAGLAIFPFVFAFDLTPGSGPGLIFETLPVAFGQVFAGAFLSFLFFILLAGAALTTGIAMMECNVRFLTERFGMTRAKAAIIVAAACTSLGLGAVLSFNVLSNFKPLFFIETFENKTIFEILDFLVANVMIPVNALLIVLFCGWALKAHARQKEFSSNPSRFYGPWLMLIKFIVPVGVLAVLFVGIG